MSRNFPKWMNVPEAGFELLTSHLNVSRETFDRLKLYHDLLIKWQRSINLVGPESIKNIWERHFLDSAQLIKILPDKITGNIVDIGSGAGFPGMVLAIMGVRNIHLVESDTKKISFLKEVARITHTTVDIYHHRAEDLVLNQVEVILARACSDLSTLLSYGIHFVSHETICLFHKGQNYIKEIEGACEKWSFDYTIIPSVTDTKGVILKLSNIRRAGT